MTLVARVVLSCAMMAAIFVTDAGVVGLTPENVTNVGLEQGKWYHGMVTKQTSVLLMVPPSGGQMFGLVMQVNTTFSRSYSKAILCPAGCALFCDEAEDVVASYEVTSPSKTESSNFLVMASDESFAFSTRYCIAGCEVVASTVSSTINRTGCYPYTSSDHNSGPRTIPAMAASLIAALTLAARQ